MMTTYFCTSVQVADYSLRPICTAVLVLSARQGFERVSVDTERLPEWTLFGATHLPSLWLRVALRDLASDFPLSSTLSKPQ
jgi:hypothetical protein